MWDGFNHRKFPRINIRCDIQVQPAKGKKSSISTITENIGLGGVCVILDRELERFDACKLQLDIKSGKKKIACDAQIMWVVPTSSSRSKKNRYDTGIEFKELTPGDLDALKNLLDRHSPKSGSENKALT